jgi:hypothetical protein
MFAANDLSIKHLAEYDRLLRERYQRLFVLCDRLRFLYLNPLVLNRAVRSVAQQNDLMEMFMNIVIENQNVYEGISARTITKAVFGKA